MKVKTTTETELEVTFPQYRKYGGTIHKIISDTEYIGVKVDEEFSMSEYKIEIMKGFESTTAGIFTEGTEVSAACFNNVYQKALSSIFAFEIAPETMDQRNERVDRQEEILDGTREDFALNWREGK